MNKIILFLILFLCQGCANELTNVGYKNVNLNTSYISKKTPIKVEKNIYCFTVLCNEYNYGIVEFNNIDDFVYNVLKENQDKGNVISDIEIKIDKFLVLPLLFNWKKITLTGNIFEKK